jgi:hypothetical protein
MNATTGKILLAAIATAIAAGASITRADEPVVVYGRAGVPVADQRIEQLSHLQGHETAAQNTVTVYGRAGYPESQDAVRTTVPTPKAYAAGETRNPIVYGRSGYPQPFTH